MKDDRCHVEYGLLVALTALAVVGILTILGRVMVQKFVSPPRLSIGEERAYDRAIRLGASPTEAAVELENYRRKK